MLLEPKPVSVTLDASIATEPGAMTRTFTASCLTCGKDFQALRTTATFCGGTCRQRFNRAINKLKAEAQPTEKTSKNDIAAEIESVWNTVCAFTERFSAKDLLEEDTGPLEMALEGLHEILNPTCEHCGEKPADGWEEVEFCRRCEISIFDLRCDKCDTRRPSVASDDMLCRQCAN